MNTKVLPSTAPPPAAPATPTPDADWFTEIYRGDAMPQLTLRAVLTGALIGAVLAVSNLYVTMKVGLSVGVALSACLLSYFSWSAVRAVSGGRIAELSILESNCMQSTASAAGFSTGSALSVAMAALMLLDPEHRQQPWWVVASFTFLTAAMGVLMAIPMKRLLIDREQLVFPSGTAAAATLTGLYADGRDAMRKAYVMLCAVAVGAVVAVLTTAEGRFQALDRFFSWMRERLVDVQFSGQIPAQGFVPLGGKPALTFGFDPGVAVVGLGMLVGTRVALSMLGAGLLLFLVIAPWLQGIDAHHAGEPGYLSSIPLVAGGAFYHPLRWSIWTGSSLMLFASLSSLALNWRSLLQSFAGLHRTAAGSGIAVSSDREIIEVPMAWMLAGMIPIGLALVALQVLAFGTAWWAGLIAVVLSFLLCFVAARVTGETDLSPTGAMGKLMQLLFSVIAPPGAVGLQASLNQNTIAAGVSANSAGAAADLLTDLKSGYLLGANPRKQFLAQFAGVLIGTMVCVPAWFLLVPDFAALEQYPVPAAQVWVATARILTGGMSNLPPTVLYGILAGAIVGIALPLLQHQVPRLRPYLPSAVGLSLGWVVPFSVSLSVAIGAIGTAIWSRGASGSAERFRLPLAAGLVAGDSTTHALLAMLSTAMLLAG